MSDAWTITRAQLIDAIANIRVRGTLLPGRLDPVVAADDMADAILEQLPALGAEAIAGRPGIREPAPALNDRAPKTRREPRTDTNSAGRG